MGARLHAHNFNPSLTIFLSGISSFIFALHFAAFLKTVMYVETVDGRRLEILEQSVERVDELNEEDESDFDPMETVR